MKFFQYSGIALMVSLAQLSHADIIGAKAGIDYWFYDGQLNRDQQNFNDQDLDQKGSPQLSLSIEHPVPLIPNAKLKYVNLNSQTENELAGVPLHEVDLDQTDAILYYEILDNIISADVGVGVRFLDGKISSVGLNTLDIDETYPVLYGLVQAKLPFTGLSAQAEGIYTNVNDAKITDLQAEIKYNVIDSLLVDLGAKVGYRSLSIDLDDYEDNDLKFEFKGPYLGLEAHF
ncbi:TIGR04219 family outer membrane beta-barrel protein [Acinetobacter radioresistens]|uniref:TIGR04219 family outer membrane beta-barrel protein n=1 Tax=Acinetobacter radioresistens TaxID=40216 RepID=UPI0009461939|nr:TIGR04219 family outer membrane beta-barrel protein [Acinetobacter radioresistens]